MTTGPVPTGRARLEATLATVADALRRSRLPARDFFVHAVGQQRILRDAYAGVMHALIFWGVTIQIVGTALNLMQMQLFIPLVELPFPRGAAYLSYELLMDLAGIAILAGVGMAAFRRGVLRPSGLDTGPGDVYALLLLALLPMVGFTVEALRLVAVDPAWAEWSPAGNAGATVLRSLGITPDLAARIHPAFYWTHMLLGLLFVASIPFSKLRHLVLGPLNIIRRSRRQESALSFIEEIETAELLGVGQICEFAPEQLLSFEACVRCGRCERNCPAALSGMPFSPCQLVHALRDCAETKLLGGNGEDQELLGTALAEEAPWACTTCGACLAGCPLFINPVDDIIDLRRYQVLTTGRMPSAVGATLRNLEQQGNPWGMPAAGRTAWTEGLDVRVLGPGEETDVLLFPGCAAAFDDRNQKVIRALVRLLKAEGVDFAILGAGEGCCGETARRLGHEYLFQVFAEENIEMLNAVRFQRIVTQCPHCFNTLKHEYPQLGGVWPVQHYSEYLGEKLPALQEGNANGHGRVTYHDPCYLGRYNGQYDAPRMLLDRAGVEQVEMERHGQNSFCCGGGGGQMWLETEADERINLRRLEQATAVEATTIATACPYCLLMFDDAIRSQGLGDSVTVLDVAEILAAQLTDEQSRATS